MKKKKYRDMTTEELAAATKRFDEPFVADRSRPLTQAGRKQWTALKRKRGRPKEGQGFKRISVSIEQGLLERVTNLAKKRRISRSKLLAQVLEDVLAREA
jgi:macrodomain Ter protein organizer (MatP/YcbG family)